MSLRGGKGAGTEPGEGVAQEGNRGAILGWRAELTIEVVQQRLLKHGAHKFTQLIRLQPRSQGDGEPKAHPSEGPGEMDRQAT